MLVFELPIGCVAMCVLGGAGWLAGAHIAGVIGFLRPMVAAGVTACFLGVALLAVPLILSDRVLSVFPRAPRQLVTLAIVGAVSFALDAGLVFGAPGATARALRSDGDWFVGGNVVPLVQLAAGHAADVIEGTAPVVPVFPPPAPAVPPAE